MYKIKEIIIKIYLLMSIFLVVYVILTQNFFQYRWDASMLHVLIFTGNEIVPEPFLLFVYGFTLFSTFIFLSLEIYEYRKKKISKFLIFCLFLLSVYLFSNPRMISFLIAFPLTIFDFILKKSINTEIPYFFMIKIILTMISMVIFSILYITIRKTYFKK